MKSTYKILIFFFMFLALAASVYAADDSPLFAAVKKGDKAAVEALLAKGADVNAKDKNGWTLLHAAAFAGKKDIAELLLAKGANVSAKTLLYELTPLHDAASAGHKDVVELLLAKGADINAKDKDGGSPRNIAGRSPLHYAAAEGHKDVAELLLAKGADVNAKVKDGRSPLHFAAEHGKKNVAELLLAKGADVNAKYMYGDTPLHDAAYLGHKDVVVLLLAKGADVSAKNMDGQTPLHKARIEVIIELLKEHLAKQARLLEEHYKSNPRAALVQLTAQLKGDPTDDNTRRLILTLASVLKPAPAIPEEASKHFVEGTAIVKAAKNPAQQVLAAQSFTEALKVAPWWGDAYYNLGVAQELAEKYDEAEKAFNFYLLTNPSAAEKREVQDRIYALSAKRKLLGAR